MSEIKDTTEKKSRYNPTEKEKYWQDFWQKKEVYKFDPEKTGELFTVDTPPPTISGALHLGHIFSYLQAEVIARFKRMEGANIRYPQGFDNNGLPTERLTEKEIGTRGQNMKLADFTDACLKVTEKYKTIYEDLWKSIGLSVDWRLLYSTISPEVQKLSQKTFKDLFEKGVIYKKNAPALYCCECQTSFAQAEKDEKEMDSVFYDLIFKTENGDDLIISTTRPELLPACDAVFVNPLDERYKNLIGKKAVTPLGAEVSILADEKAEIEKGSGAVMCCTYGDETDIYWAKSHNLKERIIIGKDGKLQNVDELPEMNGKIPEEARKIIIQKLKNEGLIKGEIKITHSVGVHERCGTPIEFLPTTQWFVKILDKKSELKKAGEKINWYPDYMQKRFEIWIENLKWDWCISRERFYGIPIPVYNCESCDNIYIPQEENFPFDPKIKSIEENCPHCKGKLVAERSVLDTWFTSALTPDINNNHELNGPLKGEMYPMSLRPLAHDIIRTWVVYTMLMGLYNHNEIPWRNLMISGHILLKKGEKISKRTGGGNYKPEELIAQESADAIRYAMLGATLGRDAYYEEQEVQKGKKLVTKIYNAGKLALGNLNGFDATLFDEKNLQPFDKWIIDKSLMTAERMAKFFDEYEYSQARRVFEEFFWSEFCDNYLEIIKGRLFNPSDDEKSNIQKDSARYALHQSFLNVLKMASPFIPHITEEMYHGQMEAENEFISATEKGYYFETEKISSIHTTKWPSVNWQKNSLDEKLISGGELALIAISEGRKAKAEKSIKLSASISEIELKFPKDKHQLLTPFLEDIKSVMRSASISLIDGEENSVSIIE